MSLAVPTKLSRNDVLDDLLFEILEAHLHGGRRGVLHDMLQECCNRTGKDACTLFQEAHISPENLKKLYEQLNVPDSFSHQKGDSLFGYIQALAKKRYGHGHLDDFHHLLKDVAPHDSLETPLFYATLITALGGIYLSLMPTHLKMLEALIQAMLPIITNFLTTTFSVLRNIPLVLFIYSALCIPLQAYHTYYHDTFRSPERRFQKWLTGTLPPLFSLISYYLSYAANGGFPPLAMFFFIASSLIGVIDGLYNLTRFKAAHTPSKDTETLDDIRQQKRYERTEKTTLVNLGAAILVSINVILWGLLPPSFFVTVGSVLFINLVGFTKSAMLNRIHREGAADLQAALRAKENADLTAENEALKPENRTLKEEVQSLKASALRFFTPLSPSTDASSDYPKTPSPAPYG